MNSNKFRFILATIFIISLMANSLVEARSGGDVIILGGFGHGHGHGHDFGHFGHILTLGSLFGAFGDGNVILGRRR
ncbi:uncharacterized protein LOC142597358 [Dermatophagoides farinae]|uniref:Uncharacterized protein n=1 Tax=Dermatophagoides farinae TaxID=6954 RepID=A0A9D4SBV0_DERFA|nr:hypothetical protein HUG17_6918 [Dermatophagoides farinae]